MTDSRRATGMGVDAQGGPVIDPTANVLQLVEAANRRTDDLRAADTKRLDDLRAADNRRTDDLRQAETRHLEAMANLRSAYDERLREVEAKRIDANRTGDVNSFNVSFGRVSDQAEALRTQLESTRISLTTRIEQITPPINDRIAALEKSQYESKGQSVGEEDTKKGVTAGQVMLIAVVGIFLSMIGTGLALYAAFRP